MKCNTDIIEMAEQKLIDAISIFKVTSEVKKKTSSFNKELDSTLLNKENKITVGRDVSLIGPNSLGPSSVAAC